MARRHGIPRGEDDAHALYKYGSMLHARVASEPRVHLWGHRGASDATQDEFARCPGQALVQSDGNVFAF